LCAGREECGNTVKLSTSQTPAPTPEKTKQRILRALADLERTAPFRPDAPGAPASLLGDWALVFASDGTVVTRTPPAQALAQLASLPGVGLSDIRQGLEAPAAADKPAGAGMTCSNAMTVGLGPFGTWSVRIKGHWLTCHDPNWRYGGGNARAMRRSGSGGSSSSSGGSGGSSFAMVGSTEDSDESGLASEVAFDGFGVRLQGWFGLDLGKLLPELTLSVPRRAPKAQPNWRTTYCDGEYRIGRGVESGGVFLFSKKKGV